MRKFALKSLIAVAALTMLFSGARLDAVERLVGIHSARVLSQAMPWIAAEAGLFKKYNLDFQLVYIASSPAVTAALLGGDAEIAITGGEGNIRAYVQGATDFVFIGAVKNVFTHSILAGPSVKTPDDLRGKRIGINRIGSNPHFFTVQALRQKGLDPVKDVQLIQSGGSPETLAALVSGSLDAACLNPPSDTQALAHGFHYAIYGPDQKIPYVATAFVTRQSVLAKRPQVIGEFMKAMAEAGKILHEDREFTYKVLGKYLRVTDRKILDASYNTEIKALERRLEIRPEGFQAILDEIAKIDPRAKNVKPDDLIDRRYLNELARSGFFDRLWEGKK
ncbi:MAG TPA: ABC transporter substrate-binding protein [Verrucomicrobiae bacterium]|jgi:ABC-type nitrate/sulfonate/bicarbonate transport system substrate-binding protein|nr:ABC transporter substrate-binding protein [Verrucomicrobiae bacterium]